MKCGGDGVTVLCRRRAELLKRILATADAGFAALTTEFPADSTAGAASRLTQELTGLTQRANCFTAHGADWFASADDATQCVEWLEHVCLGLQTGWADLLEAVNKAIVAALPPEASYAEAAVLQDHGGSRVHRVRLRGTAWAVLDHG